jgi:hypothetical protein
LPPASSPPRIAATQLPPVQARGRLLAIGSAPCGPKRTCTSKFNAMRGTRWTPAFAGEAFNIVCRREPPCLLLINDDGRTVTAMDVLAPGSARSSAAASPRSGSRYWAAIWPSAASTASTTPGTAVCAATARCRRPLPNRPKMPIGCVNHVSEHPSIISPVQTAGEGGVGASAWSAPSPTLPAWPTCAMPSLPAHPWKRTVLMIAEIGLQLLLSESG